MGMLFLLASYHWDRAFQFEDKGYFIWIDTNTSYNKSNAFVEKKVLMDETNIRRKKRMLRRADYIGIYFGELNGFSN